MKDWHLFMIITPLWVIADHIFVALCFSVLAIAILLVTKEDS